MRITDQNYRQVLAEVSEPIVGVGVTAFNRVGPALFCPDYKIVCYKESSDLEQVEKLVEVVSIQRDLKSDGDIPKLNSLAIVEHVGVRRYLRSLNKPWLFVYRTTERIDEACDELGLRLLANRSEVRDRYEDKKQFFKIGREMGLPMIPGEQWRIADLKRDMYAELVERLGTKLVFQLTDYTRGGGAGTVFVFSENDYGQLLEDIKKRSEEKKLVDVNVTEFVEGVSGSITGCVTRSGVLTGVVQTQVVDVEGLPRDKAKSGVFLGHDWSYIQYSHKVQEKAAGIAKKLGEHMVRHGYKGVFGIDLIIDGENEEVYPVECNPRYTGAFPVYTMLQLQAGEIPVDVFQLLEFLGVEYEVDVEEVNKAWKRPKAGAHLVLNNPLADNWARVLEAPRAGRYKLEGSKLVQVGDGVLWEAMESEEEFILTDGVPVVGQMVKPGLRLGKLMFKRGVLERPGQLNGWAQAVVEAVYGAYQIEATEVG